MDRSGADYFNAVNRCRHQRKIRLQDAIPVQVPIGAEETFKGVVDLVTNEADNLE